MYYKLIAIDLDDSLLGSDLAISTTNKKAIRDVVAQGTIVTIATGRMLKAAIPFVEQLELDVPVITYQGAMIVHSRTKEILYDCPVPLRYAQEIVSLAHKEQIHAQVFIDDEYYFEYNNQYSQLYYQISHIHGKEVGLLATFLTKVPTKVLLIDTPEKIREMGIRMKVRFKDELEVAISKPNYLEFTHPAATKGNAVEFLAKSLEISREQVIAIGDSYNDISMIQYAGIGVAMGNAPDEVKAAADYITGDNNSDGVAQVIQKLVLD